MGLHLVLLGSINFAEASRFHHHKYCFLDRNFRSLEASVFHLYKEIICTAMDPVHCNIYLICVTSRFTKSPLFSSPWDCENCLARVDQTLLVLSINDRKRHSDEHAAASRRQ